MIVASVKKVMLYTCYFSYGEPEANRRISKRHNGSNNGEPRELMEVWYLTKHDLDAGKEYHEWVV